ncbi:hypothetical protein TKK_0006030 [Trichogramma kaykai]|uniref:Tetratricopeptide repeat protein 7 N-terminal domain-containing protein n=1 Tax=Trichogramma kaykai TaxID=54128 RepID=A0ABD2XEB5_9HYME
MTSKKGQTWRIEAEIDKNREENNWKKVIELAEQLKSTSPGAECLAHFLGGEARLEAFLEQTPPIDVNVAKARTGLVEAKKYLLLAAGEKDKQAPVALDAQLLLGKLHYAMGMYSESLVHYQEADLQSLTEKQLPSRSLRIVAESFAIKGLCLEKLPPTSKSKYKVAEWHSQMIKCYEIASNITLVYLQEQDKVTMQQQNGTLTINSTSNLGSSSPQTTVQPTKQMGPILETAMQRAPLIHIQARNIQEAVDCYRNLLSALETTATQSLRLTLARQLAEVLLRGLKGINYTVPEISAPTIATKKSSATESPWKPKRYGGITLFTPKNEYEELILLLLICEAMAGKNAVLSQSPEFKEARVRAYQNACAIYDLLCVCVVRWNQVELLQESLERAMKFSHGEVHTWTQYALSLIHLGSYVHGFAVLKMAIKLSPQKVAPCLLAARLCYEHLNKISEGIEWSQSALSRETTNPQGLVARCHLFIGIGYSLRCANTNLKQEKAQYSQSAFDAFNKAQQNDPNDHLAEFYLAREYALNRKLTEAMTHVKTALNLRAEHIPSLQLLVLLLTAQKQYKEAMDLIKSILEEFPDNMKFLYIKATLELRVFSAEDALFTIKHMLHLWKQLYEGQMSSEGEQQSERRSETRSVFQMYSSEMSDKDSSSIRAQSLAASRVEQALSEVASSLSSFVPRTGPQKAWLLQLEVWLLLAEVFIALDHIKEATLSIQEASNIFPMSHHIMFTRGLLHDFKKEYEEAKTTYMNAVAINPVHVKSLQNLGMVNNHLGWTRLAEKILRDATKIDPYDYVTWYNLGVVLQSLEEHEAAADCFETALQNEATHPILPFSTVTTVFE